MEVEEGMRTLSVFNQTSVDGFFATKNGGVPRPHRQDDDAEFRDFVAGNASGGGELLFGRKTYEMMASFWPTPAAAEQFPAVARGMNGKVKHVVSRTLREASWQNSKLLEGDLVAAVSALKKTPGAPLVILGSGSIVSQLAQADLIDELQVLVLPVVLGEGRTMFEGVNQSFDLRLVKTRAFKNGNVFLVYESGVRANREAGRTIGA
jgi:dihydrofolate reductase